MLFDLGVSSPQLDRPERGFSYRADAPLDMRMDPDEGPTASDLVNTWPEAELARLFAANGEGRFARRIALAVVAARPVTTTGGLADVVRSALPAAVRRQGGHPARRVFQALRVAVNEELEVLADALPLAIDELGPGRALRGHRLSLGRGPHRQSSLPARRDRRLHVSPGTSLQLWRGRRRASSCSGGRGGPQRPRWRATGARRAPCCVPSSGARPDGPGDRP